MGKQDGQPGKSLGNPLNIKNVRVGAKIRHGRVTWTHTFFFILGLKLYSEVQTPTVHAYDRLMP